MFHFTHRPLLHEEAKEGGEGGGEKQPFDQAAFQSSLMAALLPEIDKRVNGLDKKYKQTFDGFKTSLDSLKPPEEKHEEHIEQPGEKGKPDLEKIAQQKRIDALEKRDAEREKKTAERERKAEEKERFSDIKAKLSGLGLAGDAEIETAFRLFKDDVRRDEEGNLVAGTDAEPFDKYMDRQIKTIYHFLLPAKTAGGAGASKGNGTTGGGAFDMDKIRPGMKPEDRAAALAEIARASQ